MGRCSVIYREVRFVIEPEMTHCYVKIEAVGDCPLGLEGWHKRSFPASKGALDILTDIRNGTFFPPEFWGQEAPEQRFS
jgi:hypothetical protein